jgi:hypothetical protein
LNKHEYDLSIPDKYYLFRNSEGPIQKEVELLDRKLEKQFLEVSGELIEYIDKLCVLIFLIDVTHDNGQRETQRMTRLHELCRKSINSSQISM